MAAKGREADIVRKAKENYISVEETEHKKKEGWLGKLKRMIQVLWELVWIDTSKLDDYTIRGKKDEKSRSFRKLLCFIE